MEHMRLHMKMFIKSGENDYLCKMDMKERISGELCKEAGITTGSFYRHFASKEELFGYLVQPAIDGLYKMYDASKELCFDSIETECIKELWKISNDTLQNLVDFIYQNFDSFKLLLECADGTKYSSFVNDVVTMEVQNTLKMLDVMHERGIIVKDLCENEFHMLSHAFLSCVFESVMALIMEEKIHWRMFIQW